MPHFRYAVTLEHLDLSHNALTSRSVSYFAEKALPQLKGISYLDFTGNNLNMSCVLAIDRASNMADHCAREDGTFCWKPAAMHYQYCTKDGCSHMKPFWPCTNSYRCIAMEKKCGACSQYHAATSQLDDQLRKNQTSSPHSSALNNDDSLPIANGCKVIYACRGSPNLSPVKAHLLPELNRSLLK